MIGNLTVFTDASFCPKTHVAGGAFWVIYGNHEVFKGCLRMKAVDHSSEAELRTSIQAVGCALRDPAVKKWLETLTGLRIILVVDALSTKQEIEREKGPRHPMAIKFVDYIRKHAIDLRINHVKGHTSGREGRDYVNRWCDKFARKTMREARAAHLLSLNPPALEAS